MFSKLMPNRKGQGLVEYGLIIAGVTLIAAAAVSTFGHKTTDLIATVAAVLPGAHADDNAPIVSGALIETAANADGAIAGDVAGIAADGTDTPRLGNNVLGVDPGADGGFGGLVLEAE